MHKQRIYIDTSVIGGCFDEMFAEWSNKLFDEFIAGDKIAVISETSLKEIEDAPFYVKEKLFSIPEEFSEILSVNSDVEFLAQKYIEHKAIPPSCAEDALHIAYSTINDVDVLVSWNFKHIVNLNRIKKYNSVNLFYGYKTVEIRSPKEVLDNEL